MRLFSIRFWISLWVCFFLISCLPNKKWVVGSTAQLLEEVARSSSKQSDLRMIREGMPAFLMLIDGMIEALPENDQLLITAAQSYASFVSAFIDEKDKEYAKYLLGKAKHYALRSLEIRGFKNPVDRPLDDFQEALRRMGKKEVPYLFWSATCWANWINLHLDSMEALSELPRVEGMMKRVLELDEGFYHGGPHLFMGIWFASRPKIAGGDLKKSRDHFLRAIDLGKGKFLMSYVYYAEYYARMAQDKELFTSTLQKVLNTSLEIAPELTLLNTVAQKRASELLNRGDEYFE